MDPNEFEGAGVQGESPIRLHFFDTERERSLRARWDRLAVHPGTPRLAEVPDGLIPKLSRAFIASNMELHCVFDASNCPVPASARIRGAGERGSESRPEGIDFGDVARDERPAYLLGAAARHYGHFLLETLSRAWAWDQSRHDVAIILSPPILDFARAICSFVPGLSERLEVIATNTRFRHVTVPSPAFSISRDAYAGFKTMCESISEAAVPRPGESTQQPVYFSRARLGRNSSRVLVGELRLERMLKAEGFRIVHPETLPIAEQIALVNRHKWLVAPMGSACHTRLFSRIENNLLMFTSEEIHPNYVLCDLLNKGATHYANVFRSPMQTDPLPVSMKPMVLDGDRLLQVLKDLGLVRAAAMLDRRLAHPAAAIERSRRLAQRRAAKRAKRMEKRSRKGTQ